MRIPTATLVANLVLYQVGWLACVLGAALGWPWTGSAAAIVIVGYHLTVSPNPVNEFRLILILLAFGALFDSLLLNSGWAIYSEATPIAWLAPIWILGVWACFATIMNVGLRWLKGQSFYAFLFGALGGPLAYWAGSELGAMTIRNVPELMTALALGFGILMTALSKIPSRMDGWSADNAQVRTA